MPYVDPEAFHAFNEGYERCTTRLPGNKRGVDSDCLRALVRSDPASAYRFVEIQCHMAQSQPGYLQIAVVIAWACLIELGDGAAMKLVQQTAANLGVADPSAGLTWSPNVAAAGTEPPERAAARAWWRKSEQEGGHCDECGRPMRRGEGYLITGRRLLLGTTPIDMGEELLCRDCFDRLRAGRQGEHADEC